MHKPRNRGPGVRSPKTGQGQELPLFSPELPLAKSYSPSGFHNDYIPNPQGSVFDPGHIVEAVREEYGERIPTLYVGCLSTCWYCYRDDIRIKKFLFSDNRDDFGRSICYGICARCEYDYFRSTPAAQLAFRECCERHIMIAYPQLNMGVAV